jgi:hypothetical protein
LQLQTAGTTALTINSSQQVLFNTTTNTFSAYGAFSEFRKDQNSASYVTIQNQNAGSSGSAGLLLTAYGNSWVNAIGSNANNTNALTWALDATSPSIKMTLDASGTLLLGSGVVSASSSGGLNVNATQAGGSSVPFTLQNQSTSNGSGVYLAYRGKTSAGAQADYNYIQFVADSTSSNTSSMRFYSSIGSGPVEAMRIDTSGNLLVGTTTAFNSFFKMSLKVTSSYGGLIIQPGADDYTAIQFNNAAGVGKGSISVSSTATAYNTSSDYRLKNTIAPMTGALAKVIQLKPCTYKWNEDNSESEGFIAHELAEVCPHAVTGTKDEVDADGNPKYQGIDTSFLVATLTAAIQELSTQLTELKAEVATLRGA